MKDTIIIDIKANIKGGEKLMKIRFWIGTKLIQLASFVMRTEIEVSIE